MKRPIAVLMALACSGAGAGQWKGHLSTLFDAQVACTNSDSVECEPFLAEAVAVAEVLTEIAKVPGLDEKGMDVTVTFHNMNQQKCSQNWFQSMNGQSLMHSALGLSVDIQSAKSIYWVAALLRASQQLCHS
jgi:hypothetical protein